MVIDTSALLSYLFDEPHADWVHAQLKSHNSSLQMSTVNLAEALIIVRDQFPQRADAIEASLIASGIEFIPPSTEIAKKAARARLEFPLNLGDCFAYALAMLTNEPLLTLDSDFARTDIVVISP